MFTHARIITMEGDEVIEDGTLVVQGNRILSVGTAYHPLVEEKIPQ